MNVQAVLCHVQFLYDFKPCMNLVPTEEECHLNDFLAGKYFFVILSEIKLFDYLFCHSGVLNDKSSATSALFDGKYSAVRP